MPTLTELHEQRGRLVTAARERLDQITANTDESRATELGTQHDAAMAALDALDATIAREERTAKAEREQEERSQRDLRGRRPIAAVDDAPAGSGDGEITYRDAFHAYLRAEGQMAELSPEQRSVLRGGYQAVKREERAQVTSSAASGGYTVPVELQAEIVKTMAMWGPMYDPGVTREMTTSSGASMPWPTVNDTASRANPTTQGQTLADDGSGDVVFGQTALSAYAFATPWIRVSKEFADDSVINAEAFLGDLLGERLGRTANSRLTNGTGVNMPHGLVVVASAGITGASATAIAADELFDLQHSVDPAYRLSPKCGWMFNDLTLKAVRKLKDSQGRYIWQMGDIRAGAPAQLLDKPYNVNQDMPSIAAGNRSILFGDMSKYIVRKVGAPLIGAIQDKDFWPGFGIAGWIRFDGNLMDQAAVKAYTQAAQ